MERALYGPEGFYTRGGLAGRRGDFLTAPEVGPLFGAVLARFLDAEWQRLGRPAPFTVVDVGAGPGTLARSIVAAASESRAAMRYVAVELADVQRRIHPEGVESRADLPPEPIVGVVIANELLDNLPFRLAVFDGAWREAYVSTAADGTLSEVLSAPFDPLPDILPATPPLGARAPLIDAARAWLDGARGLVRSGSVIVFDYSVYTTSELALRPWRDWLRTYRRHERGGHYLATPGEQDVTTDVPLDQLPAPDERWTQAEFLRQWGITELVEEGRRAWAAGATKPDLAALTMRSRSREAEALLDPAGLGVHTVAIWRSPSEPAKSDDR